MEGSVKGRRKKWFVVGVLVCVWGVVGLRVSVRLGWLQLLEPSDCNRQESTRPGRQA